MKNITPHWNIDNLNSLVVEQAPDPTIGFNVEDGINLAAYQNLVSAGVYRGLPDFFELEVFEKEFHWIENKGYAVHKMLPGSILPLHRDKYAFYANHHKIIDFNRIVRIIVFLENHKLGHILQVEDTPISEWKAGDYIYWTGKKAHLAANFGNEIRYTLQITGLLKPDLA